MRINQTASLTQHYWLTNKTLPRIQMVINVTYLMIILFMIFGDTPTIVLVGTGLVLGFPTVSLNLIINRVKEKLFTPLFIRNRLLWFIRMNGLFEEKLEQYEKYENEVKRIEEKRFITHSVELSFEISETTLVITAHKTGDKFVGQLSKLEEPLSSLFAKNIQEVINRNDRVEYHLILDPPKRLNLGVLNHVEYSDDLNINLGYGFTI